MILPRPPSLCLIVMTMLALSATSESEAQAGSSEEEIELVNAIIFSKDRAAQLDLLLQSLNENLPRSQIRSTVIYKATTLEYQRGYDRVQRLHPWAIFIPEPEEQSEFKELVMYCIESPGIPYSSFLVDDLVFINAFNFATSPDFQFFIQNSEIFTFSLRLHPNVNGGISGPGYNGFNEYPTSPFFINKFNVWDWTQSVGDWAYPMSLNGNVFRSSEIGPLTSEATFYNPSLLEASLSRMRHMSRFMSCPDIGIIVNIPANVVQQTYANGHMGVAAQKLNDQFLSGARLTLHHLRGVRTTSGQSILPLVFHPEDTYTVGRNVRMTQLTELESQLNFSNQFSSRFLFESAAENLTKKKIPLIMFIGISKSDVGPGCAVKSRWISEISNLNFPFEITWPECFAEKYATGREIEAVILIDRAVLFPFPFSFRAHSTCVWLTVPESVCPECYNFVKFQISNFAAVFVSADKFLQWAAENSPKSKIYYAPAGGMNVSDFTRLENMEENKKCVGFENERLAKHLGPPPENFEFKFRDFSCKYQILDFLELRENMDYFFHSDLNGFLPALLLQFFIQKKFVIFNGPAVAQDVFNITGFKTFESKSELRSAIAEISTSKRVTSFNPDAVDKNTQMAKRFANPLNFIGPRLTQILSENSTEENSTKFENLNLNPHKIQSEIKFLVIINTHEIVGGAPALEKYLNRSLSSVLSQIKTSSVSLAVISPPIHFPTAKIIVDGFSTKNFIVKLYEGLNLNVLSALSFVGELEEETVTMFLDARDHLQDSESLFKLSNIYSADEIWLTYGGTNSNFVPFYTDYEKEHNSYRTRFSAAGATYGAVVPFSFKLFLANELYYFLPGLSVDHMAICDRDVQFLCLPDDTARQRSTDPSSPLLSNIMLLLSLLELAGPRATHILDFVYYKIDTAAVTPADFESLNLNLFAGLRVARLPRTGVPAGPPTVEIMEPRAGRFFEYHSSVTFRANIKNIWIPEEATTVFFLDGKSVGTGESSAVSFSITTMFYPGIHNMTIAAVSLSDPDLIIASSSTTFGVL